MARPCRLRSSGDHMRPLVVEKRLGGLGLEVFQFQAATDMQVPAAGAGSSPSGKKWAVPGEIPWHVFLWSLARATRSRTNSHPTAAIKIDETAWAAQSNLWPRPSAILFQTPLQGPNFKEGFLTTRAASGSSGPSERPSALHTGLSSARSWKSSNNGQCTAAVCGLA